MIKVICQFGNKQSVVKDHRTFTMLYEKDNGDIYRKSICYGNNSVGSISTYLGANDHFLSTFIMEFHYD